MKKYMVIEVYEREIGEPEFFNTKELAREEMSQRFSEVVGLSLKSKRFKNMDIDTIFKILYDEGTLDDNCGFEDDVAWAETANHDNWDCRIIEVEI